MVRFIGTVPFPSVVQELLSQIIWTVHDYNVDITKFSGGSRVNGMEKARKVDVQGQSSKEKYLNAVN